MKLYKNWTLVYAFSKKLATTDKRFEQSLEIFKQSIEYNKRFHKLKIYSDKETFEYIYQFGIEIELIDFEDFIFLDDIKIKVLPKLTDNEVLIDPDVFLFSNLKLPTTYDVILDRPVNINVYWLQEQIESSKEYEFSKLINFKPKKDLTGNIGVIKFFNKNLQELYIDFYSKVRDIAKKEKDKLPPFPSYSILLGEVGLKTVIDDTNSSFFFASEISSNKYDHVAGPRKFDFDSIKKYLSPIKNNLI